MDIILIFGGLFVFALLCGALFGYIGIPVFVVGLVAGLAILNVVSPSMNQILVLAWAYGGFISLPATVIGLGFGILLHSWFTQARKQRRATK